MAIVQQTANDLETSKLESEANLNGVLTKNKMNVLPELDRLVKLLNASKEEVSVSSRAYADDEQRLQELACLKESLSSEEKNLQQGLNERGDILEELLRESGSHTEALAKMRKEAK